MADDVPITAGTGTNIVTDDISATNRHYQRIKISDGTADSEVHLKVVAEDAAFAGGDTGIVAMAVRGDTPANLSSTTGDYEPLQVSNGALWVSPLGFPKTVSVDITRPADATAYAANDALSNSTTAPTSGGFTLTGIARKSGGSVLITDVWVTNSNPAATPLQGEVFLFSQSVTNINDNAAWAVSDAEIKTCVGRVGFALETGGNNGFYHAQNLNILATCVGSADLRFLVRVKNAYTPTASEVLTVVVKAIQLD